MTQNLYYLDALASVYMNRTCGDTNEAIQARLQAYHGFINSSGNYHNNLVAAISFIYANAVRSPSKKYVLVVSDTQIVDACYRIIDNAMMTYPENLEIISATNDLAHLLRGQRIEHTHFHLSAIPVDLVRAAIPSIVSTVG